MTNSGCTVRDYSCMQMTSHASQDDGSWPRQDLHYISIHYPAPRPCTTQMNSFFTGQRNLICSWWWCCQLCSRNCISSLNNEKLHNFSTPPPALLDEPGQSARMVCQDGEEEEIGGGGSEQWICRKLFASCGSAHQTSIQPLQPLLPSISSSHQRWRALLAPQVLFDYLRPMMTIHPEKGGWGGGWCGVIKIF